MDQNVTITIILFVLGGLTMTVGIFKTNELIRIIPESKYAINWKMLLLLMVVFLFGYVAACGFLIMGKEKIVYALTGLIFFLGAIFVLISVITGKQTIVELRSSLITVEEKEVMMQEIHHRVKNNLQIIKSLLKLQAGHTKEEQTREMFRESENRIMSMALIHEKLYQSENFADVNVEDYVTELVMNLADIYELEFHVDFKIDIQINNLTMDILTPFGLLLNEIISNSFKHGFKGKTEGDIVISATHPEKGKVKLLVGDNGIGFSLPETESESKSLGLQLIHILSDQLEGTLTQTEDHGTTYEIVFNEVLGQK
jgi:two-component sensor histidine kinase